MTAEEMIKILQSLPPKERIGFEIKTEEVDRAKDYLKECSKNREDILLDIISYERTDIGSKDDELFYFGFSIIEI